MVLISHFKHTYITAKQLKAKKRFCWYHFSFWAVSTRELLGHKGEQIGQSIHYVVVVSIEKEQACVLEKESSDVESPKR